MTSEATRKMFADSLSANDNPRTLAEVEAELDLVRAEIEPLNRTEAALLKERQAIWEAEALREKGSGE